MAQITVGRRVLARDYLTDSAVHGGQGWGCTRPSPSRTAAGSRLTAARLDGWRACCQSFVFLKLPTSTCYRSYRDPYALRMQEGFIGSDSGRSRHRPRVRAGVPQRANLTAHAAAVQREVLGALPPGFA
jgi:hypothetical protein